ncbi:hypothetical protein ACQP2X_28685 [Actinoplanes sp. CA-131856]
MSPPLPPDVDPDLWFDTACGRHYLLDGNPHTFPGRMDAYCAERGIRTRVSKAEIVDCSEQTRYFVRGFLSGNEPAPPDAKSVTDPAWNDATTRFRETGRWTDPREGSEARDSGEAPDGSDAGEGGDDAPEWLRTMVRERQTARVALVVDMPTGDAGRAVEVATTLAERVGRRVCDDPGPVGVSAAVQFTRVYALVGVTGHRPWVAVQTAMTALGRSGWAPATPVEGEQYVTAGFKANREPNRGLEALGVSAVEIHAAYGLGHDPSRTPAI